MERHRWEGLTGKTFENPSRSTNSRTFEQPLKILVRFNEVAPDDFLPNPSSERALKKKKNLLSKMLLHETQADS